MRAWVEYEVIRQGKRGRGGEKRRVKTRKSLLFTCCEWGVRRRRRSKRGRKKWMTGRRRRGGRVECIKKQSHGVDRQD